MSTHDHHDETARRLTSALHQEAETVSTDPTALQRIQRRTSAEGASSRQRWFLAAIGAATATAAVIAAVVVIGDQGSPRPSTPAASDPPPTKSSQLPVEQVTVPVVYLGLGHTKALYTEQHTLTTDKPPVIAALDMFLANQALDPDYMSGWPPGIQAVGVGESHNEVSIELEGPRNAVFAPRADLGPRGGELAVQALFRTAGLNPRGTGTLAYNGEPVSTILGVDLPVTGEQDVDVRAMVSIDNIEEGQTVSSPVTVKVSGNTFEANVNWLLTDADGAKRDNGYATVGSYGEWAQADVDLGALEPGTYTFKAFEPSAMDGSEINVDDKTFTVE